MADAGATAEAGLEVLNLLAIPERIWLDAVRTGKELFPDKAIDELTAADWKLLLQKLPDQTFAVQTVSGEQSDIQNDVLVIDSVAGAAVFASGLQWIELGQTVIAGAQDEKQKREAYVEAYNRAKGKGGDNAVKNLLMFSRGLFACVPLVRLFKLVPAGRKQLARLGSTQKATKASQKQYPRTSGFKLEGQQGKAKPLFHFRRSLDDGVTGMDPEFKQVCPASTSLF